MSYFWGRVRTRRDASVVQQGAPQCVPLQATCDAAGRPSGSNPSGNPENRPPAVLRLLAVAPLRRVAAPCIQPVLGAARPQK